MATIIARGPLYLRTALLKGKWRGAQIEFQQPITLQQVCSFQNDAFQGWVGGVQSFQMCGGFWDSDGAATGDAIASGDGAFSVVVTDNPTKQLLDIRPGRAVKLGRGAQIEFDQPLPLMVLYNLDGAGSAQGDSSASADGTFDAYPFSNWQDEYLRRGPGLSARRLKGAQQEFQTPLSIQIISNRDGAGLAQGDAIASGAGDGDAPFDGTALGDSSAAATGASDTYPFANWDELVLRRGPNKAVKLGRGAQIEFQQPITTGTQLSVAADGSAQGDANASATGESLADAAGAAQGDAVASADGTSLNDQAGTAQGDANASATGVTDAYPFANWNEILKRRGPGRAVKLGRGAQIEFQTPLTVSISSATDGAGTAQGDANADAVSDSIYYPWSAVWSSDSRWIRAGKAIKLGRGAQLEFQSPLPVRLFSNRYGDGSAIGDANALGVATSIADSVGSAIGDARANGDPDGSGTGSAIGDCVVAGFADARRRRVRVIHTRESAGLTPSGESSHRTNTVASSPRSKTSAGSDRTAAGATSRRSKTEVF